ncbi:MAG: cardiolipin synthase, partial [Phycisphaerales bacterium]|nr:cardiolipin synthase [Phycisphaerales bacterium]
ARGVRCRVLVDAVGSRPFLRSDLCAAMRRAGVLVCEALPVNPLRMLLARVDLRNHRKIVVIDHRIGYTGSHNLAEADFLSKKKPRAGDWVDASVRLEGPAVGALQAVFLGDWLLDSVEPDEEVERLARRAPVEVEGGSVAQLIPSGPDRESGAVQQAMLALIYAADRELILTTPYFVPDESTRAALCIAARRGVRTTVVVPAHPDARLVAAASRAFFQELLDAGVRIRRFRKGLLHAKTFTIDGEIAVITSVNMDMRSFFLNFESTLVVYDRRFAEELRRAQHGYMELAPEVSAGEWAHRPLVNRFVDNIAQLAAPLL